MIIEKTQTTYVFRDGDNATTFPIGAILFVTSDRSATVTIRLKGSRKNVLSFDYTEVENYEAQSANDLVQMLL